MNGKTDGQVAYEAMHASRMAHSPGDPGGFIPWGELDETWATGDGLCRQDMEAAAEAVRARAAGLDAMATEFHTMLRVHNGWNPPAPTADLPPGLHLLRRALLEEEVAELAEAVEARNVVKIADALGDIVYVVAGTAFTYGIPLDAVLAEVHRSNMTKTNTPEESKLVKGPGYEPPRIPEVLAGKVTPQGGQPGHAACDTAMAGLRARVADRENGITWGTSCTTCATVLDSCARETFRAEAAGEQLAAARETIGNFLAQHGNSTVPTFQVALGLAHTLQKVLDGTGRPG